MKNVSVEQLRKAGYKVCIIHSRHFYDKLTKLSEIQARIDLVNADHGFDAAGRPNYDWCHENHINPMGGQTEVILTTPQGLSYSHIAKVKDTQPFSYRVGRNIAIGRCFADINEDAIDKTQVSIQLIGGATVFQGWVDKQAFLTNAHITLNWEDTPPQSISCFEDSTFRVELFDARFADLLLDKHSFSLPRCTTSYPLHPNKTIGRPPSHYGFETKVSAPAATPSPAAVTA
ncbi:MAG: hypothetical protein EBU46_00530 [Nitrosomonadaceae bacterium]|nr:hypothetical protein [Nitrosomonadaceae bacterium]